jgi:tRNA dimethylallyltransferase
MRSQASEDQTGSAGQPLADLRSAADLQSGPDLQSGADLQPLVVILGPTAVGKTELAIHLAQRLEGEIISADSRLFYRHMDIGTAKPTLAERALIPHHLIDVADPDETWSLARFQHEAWQVIGEIHAHQRLPFLVGGTGQYIRAVTHGWQPPRVKPDLRLRNVLERWATEVGVYGLHERLAVLDPVAAAKIDPRNLRRTVRALEVILTSGERFSQQRLSFPSPFRILQIGLIRPRPELYARIDFRVLDMIEAGLVGEVRALLAMGYDPELPTLSAIGYREIIAYLQGHLSLDEAVTQIQRATRIFVRRQANWFKLDDPSIFWFQFGSGTLGEVEKVVRDWLKPA